MRATLQRKCGCAGACGSCREQRESIPHSVNRVLAGSGAPLDLAARKTFEPRFGHDFSSVRVHTDANAASSARDVHARAWTVGNHIAFGAGQGPSDRALLAHELTHVVQQSAMPRASSITIGAANDPAESEADAVASKVMRGRNVDISSRDGTAIRRQKLPDPFTFDEDMKKVREDLHIPGKTMDGEGVPLSPTARARAESATGRFAPQVPSRSSNTKPIFVLHDTDAGLTLADTKGAAAKSEGPFGLGIAGLVAMKQDLGTSASDPGLYPTPRPFYESHRPSASGWEQLNFGGAEGARKTRFGKIWNAISEAEQNKFIARAFERSPIKRPLNAMRQAVGKAIPARTDEEKNAVPDGGSTTSLWTMEAICGEVCAVGAGDIVKPGPGSEARADEVMGHCLALREWFKEWTSRIERTTNVEIVQRHEGFTRPAYSEKQYTDVALLYLWASLEADMWPYITTHYQIDKHIGRTDPRCYDVHRLYRTIADMAGPFPGAIYGIDPKYGPKPEHNVWWNDAICHGAPPA